MTFDDLINGEETDNQAVNDNELLDTTVDVICCDLEDIIETDNKHDYDLAYNNIYDVLDDLNDKSSLLQDVELERDLFNALDDLDCFYHDGYTHKDSEYKHDKKVIREYLKYYKNGYHSIFLN